MRITEMRMTRKNYSGVCCMERDREEIQREDRERKRGENERERGQRSMGTRVNRPLGMNVMCKRVSCLHSLVYIEIWP